ncbi:DUF4296 domain-containing protein [Pararhodonellum marinum]|uniref:DUF4296 domain-containing protein n=1 Tax=Pararhodonellum marinum TaxID=2755358 RepID=UPI00188F8739|nr:DUF4296 domain-containing protein [Pararhodonellum marinum]
MKNLIVLFLGLYLLAACTTDRDPKWLISEDKMVEVLIDIHMSEGLVSSFPISYDSSKKLYPMFEYEVFKKHQVNDSVFTKSLEHYMLSPRKMERIYSRTIDSLSIREKIGDN